MSTVPPSPRIFHITHVDNLTAIITAGGLWSDAQMIAQGKGHASVGISNIKHRRLGLPVKCHEGLRVGECVPFYFCPRSVMLYLLHRSNHAELDWSGGQEPIVHLEADLHASVAWADHYGRPWAFSLSNAGAGYAQFRHRLDQLDEVDWTAVAATDFRDPAVKEGKQAEFLVFESFPWPLVRRVGVCTPAIAARVREVIVGTPGSHRPDVEVLRSWYY
ncbi:MAG: DUF4433 domain-containing protein [bacterium]